MVPGARRNDLLLTGLLLTLGLVEALELDHHRMVAVPALCAIAVSFAWRRTAPMVPAIVVAVAVPLQTWAGIPVNATLSVTIAVVLAGYVAGRHLSRESGAVALAALTVAAVVSVCLGNRSLAENLPFAALLCAAPWAAGVTIRRRHAHTERVEYQRDEARLLAQQVTHEAERATRQAVADERARIARELHDVVSHSLTVIGLQTGGVRRLLLPHQERERQALLVVEEATRQAHDEMRRLLQLLRGDDDGELTPQPGLDDLPALIAATRTAGLAVDFEEATSSNELAAGVQLAVYRIVQEALTNIRKHSGADVAKVRVDVGPAAVDVEICDDGRGRAPTASDGYGLIGMQERVALYGGTLHAGSAPEGGYRVVARLPLRLAGA